MGGHSILGEDGSAGLVAPQDRHQACSTNRLHGWGERMLGDISHPQQRNARRIV
jgi:hypothetical protein